MASVGKTGSSHDGLMDEPSSNDIPALRPVVVSCIRPTSAIHIGNYFGALRNWVELQESHTCIFGIADLHSLSILHSDPQLAREQATRQRAFTERMVHDLLAIGLDTSKCLLYVQSLVPEIMELYWLLSCLCPYRKLISMPVWERYQNRAGTGLIISPALLTYPILQAADVLMFRASFVPVGRDQERHLEIARMIAARFNRNYQPLFPVPQIFPPTTLQIGSLIDPDTVMSKDLGREHWVGIFESDIAIEDKIRWARTEGDADWQAGTMQTGVANLLTILEACGRGEEADSFRRAYEAGTHSFKVLKTQVTDSLQELSRMLRARRAEIDVDPAALWKQVEEMSERARVFARETLQQVREALGLPSRRI